MLKPSKANSLLHMGEPLEMHFRFMTLAWLNLIYSSLNRLFKIPDVTDSRFSWNITSQACSTHRICLHMGRHRMSPIPIQEQSIWVLKGEWGLVGDRVPYFSCNLCSSWCESLTQALLREKKKSELLKTPEAKDLSCVKHLLLSICWC